MTPDEFVDYLCATSVRCRFLADTASDTEVAGELRRMADEMEAARSVLSEVLADSVARAGASRGAVTGCD